MAGCSCCGAVTSIMDPKGCSSTHTHTHAYMQNMCMKIKLKHARKYKCTLAKTSRMLSATWPSLPHWLDVRQTDLVTTYPLEHYESAALILQTHISPVPEFLWLRYQITTNLFVITGLWKHSTSSASNTSLFQWIYISSSHWHFFFLKPFFHCLSSRFPNTFW